MAGALMGGKKGLTNYFQVEFSLQYVENLKLFHNGNFIKTLNKTRYQG